MFTKTPKPFLPPRGGEGVAFALRASSQRLGAHAAARDAYTAFIHARDGADVASSEANCEFVPPRARRDGS